MSTEYREGSPAEERQEQADTEVRRPAFEGPSVTMAPPDSARLGTDASHRPGDGRVDPSEWHRIP